LTSDLLFYPGFEEVSHITGTMGKGKKGKKGKVGQGHASTSTTSRASPAALGWGYLPPEVSNFSFFYFISLRSFSLNTSYSHFI